MTPTSGLRAFRTRCYRRWSMPAFLISGSGLSIVQPTAFGSERDLQRLIEANLTTVFDCKLVATEFSTGSVHCGRIDTLALSEDGNPVIIEYKNVASSELINQALYYASWLHDHRGDFQVAAHRALGADVSVDWEEIRVICLAPTYKKFDLHAVTVMGANIELWQFRRYENGTLFLDEVFSRRGAGHPMDEQVQKNPVMVAAGKKAAQTRLTGSYTIEGHLEKAQPPIIEIVAQLRDYIASLDESVKEEPKKLYIAYKLSQNFVCMEIRKRNPGSCRAWFKDRSRLYHGAA